MRCWLSPLLLLIWCVSAQGGVRTKTVEYRQGDTVFEGYLAYDDSASDKRPGVLVIPEEWGLNNFAKTRAEQLARLGYVAFAADMYGNGVQLKDAKEAFEFANSLRDNRNLMRLRAEAGLATLLRQPHVDPKRIAVLGYSFGGTTALELARGGADVAVAISFHGELNSPTTPDAKRINSKILILHGSGDPLVTPEPTKKFEEEMRKAGVDLRLVKFDEAIHSVPNSQSIRDRNQGVTAYDSKADQRSFEIMKLFLNESFGQGKAVSKANEPAQPKAPAGVPEKAMKVLRYVDKEKAPMKGYEGGRTFLNIEKHLPKKDDKGKSITYQEWDVNPHTPGVNRGAERLITGSDGSAYYTDDHYKTFKKIR
jgi:dienelactone hydrolase